DANTVGVGNDSGTNPFRLKLPDSATSKGHRSVHLVKSDASDEYRARFECSFDKRPELSDSDQSWMQAWETPHEHKFQCSATDLALNRAPIDFAITIFSREARKNKADYLLGSLKSAINPKDVDFELTDVSSLNEQVKKIAAYLEDLNSGIQSIEQD